MTQLVTTELPNQIRSCTFEYEIPSEITITAIVIPDLIRSKTYRRLGALLRVHYDTMRSIAIGCKLGLTDCPDHDKGDQDLTMIGPDRYMYIHSQLDYRHLPN